MSEYSQLYQYCTTERQREVIQAIIQEGGKAQASRVLSMDIRTVYRILEKLRARANDLPIGHVMSGQSVLTDADGNVKLTWTKTAKDSDVARAALHEAAEALSERIKKAKPVAPPKHGEDELLNLMVITDYHLGMRAWPEETRQQAWDLEIAETLLIKWFHAAINQSPKAHTAVFAQLGDFLHWDGLEQVTPTSGHILDGDTRFALLVRTAIRVIRQIIALLLQRHQEVIVLMAEGNHDLASSVWLRELLYSHYENEPRVKVDRSADPYYCVEWGDTSLFFHHGHKRRLANVDDVFAAKFRDVFGRTKHSYAHTGHLHHSVRKETNLMMVEQHRTLSASDAYASRGGWMSGRDAQVITYHNALGDVGRSVISPERVMRLAV